jgi:hypothetical protein
MAQVSVLGIDLATQVFQAVGMDDTGTIVWRKRSTRRGLMPLIAQRPPVVIGMDPVAARTTGRGTDHVGGRGGVSEYRGRPPPHARTHPLLSASWVYTAAEQQPGDDKVGQPLQ